MYLLGPSCKYWQLSNIHSKDISQVVVLTDSLSVLAVLCNCKLPLLSRTQGQVIQTRHMTFRRVPAHVEQVDMDILVAKSDQQQSKSAMVRRSCDQDCLVKRSVEQPIMTITSKIDKINSQYSGYTQAITCLMHTRTQSSGCPNHHNVHMALNN